MVKIFQKSKIMRGALIVIEGCDRSGKSTQAKKLVTSLQKQNIMAKYINFPDRTTTIGQVINKYLNFKQDLSDETIHLLFSANRWELSHSMRDDLKNGVTLIVDRYAFSGAAFSASKGLDMEWCKSPDVGLPRPDKVFLLTLNLEAQAKRKGFGQERYEESQFQSKVMANFQHLEDDTWENVDADRTEEELHEELLKKVLLTHKSIESANISTLWKEGLF